MRNWSGENALASIMNSASSLISPSQVNGFVTASELDEAILEKVDTDWTLDEDGEEIDRRDIIDVKILSEWFPDLSKMLIWYCSLRFARSALSGWRRCSVESNVGHMVQDCFALRRWLRVSEQQTLAHPNCQSTHICSRHLWLLFFSICCLVCSGLRTYLTLRRPPLFVRHLRMQLEEVKLMAELRHSCWSKTLQHHRQWRL